jgi:hypothetical protein
MHVITNSQYYLWIDNPSCASSTKSQKAANRPHKKLNAEQHA